MFNNKKGFTLIELIITMVIISILVLLAAPELLGYVDQAKLAQIKNDSKVLEQALLTEETFMARNDMDYSQIFTDNTVDEGIGKTNSILKNQKQKTGVQIKPEFVAKHVDTDMGYGNFYYDKENSEVYYYYDGITSDLDQLADAGENIIDDNSIDHNTNNNEVEDPEDAFEDDIYNPEDELDLPEIPEEIYEPSEEDYEIAKGLFRYTENNKEITVHGLAYDNYFNNTDIGLLRDLEYDGRRIVAIEDQDEKWLNHYKDLYEEKDWYKNIQNSDKEKIFNTQVFAFSDSAQGFEYANIGRDHIIGEFPKLRHLEKIGDNAFKKAIANIKINEDTFENVKEIGPNAFLGFRGDVKDISDYKLYFPNVTLISARAFAGANITEVFIPQVETIKTRAFEGSKLKKLPEAPKLKQLESFAFSKIESPGIEYIIPHYMQLETKVLYRRDFPNNSNWKNYENHDIVIKDK